MKKGTLIAFGLVFKLAFLLLFSQDIQAQKIAYIDTEYILKNMPEYEQAQKDLDEMSQRWQKEIEDKYSKIEKLRKDYQADLVLLPDEMKKQRREEIKRKEEEARALQRKRFGVGGDLFKKRQELIAPLQDKIWEAINKIAKTGNYSFVFDKANQSTLMFADPKYDKSDAVLKKMGYKVGQ